MPAREMTMTKLERESPTISRREKFRQVSYAWQCFLEFLSAHQGVGMSGITKQKGQVCEEEMQVAQLAR